jgi:hypothetical protein
MILFTSPLTRIFTLILKSTHALLSDNDELLTRYQNLNQLVFAAKMDVEGSQIERGPEQQQQPPQHQQHSTG